MKIELVCPRVWWDALLQEGLRAESEHRVYGAPLGHARTADYWRLLVRGPFRPVSSGAEADLQVLFRSGSPGVQLYGAAEAEALLVLGRGPAEGRWAGWVKTPEGQEPLTQLFFPGSGMLRIGMAPPDNTQASRWSRTRSALGEDVWQRLAGLKIGIVGCGRLGSAVAQALARNGIRQLILVDPDRVELHNLGEGEGLTEKDVGAFKAEVLARHLASDCPWIHAVAVVASVETWPGLQALKTCDLLICAADTRQARRNAARLAACYLLPLLELGTGVFALSEGGRQLGLEVWLFLPGEACRFCFDHNATNEEMQGLPWWADRMGSLRSLNLTAAGLGLLALEGLVREEIRHSTAWIWQWPGELQQISPSVCERCRQTSWGQGDAFLLATVTNEHEPDYNTTKSSYLKIYRGLSQTNINLPIKGV